MTTPLQKRQKSSKRRDYVKVELEVPSWLYYYFDYMRQFLATDNDKRKDMSLETYIADSLRQLVLDIDPIEVKNFMELYRKEL